LWLVAALACVLAAGGLYTGWQAQQRVQALELELVRRQQDAGTAATEARLLADQAQDAAREAVAKVSLLDARVTEAAAQRTQVEDALQSLTRARDDSVLADLDVAVRLAAQHSVLTGSTETLVRALKEADQRLAQLNQPRLERVRRAVARDLERLSGAGLVDVATLTARLDDVIRQVDELPLLALADGRRPSAPGARDGRVATPPAPPASAPAGEPAAPGFDTWFSRLPEASRVLAVQVWDEARSLLRVTRIEHPDALLLAPEQAYFVRQNLELRLLNARLALLSRQFDVAQADLREAQGMLERYFDRQSRRVQGAADLLRQVATQSRSVTVPRPEDTLAALSTAAATR
jgi:uroporphyrin-3 C-methyltransferase